MKMAMIKDLSAGIQDCDPFSYPEYEGPDGNWDPKGGYNFHNLPTFLIRTPYSACNPYTPRGFLDYPTSWETPISLIRSQVLNSGTATFNPKPYIACIPPLKRRYACFLRPAPGSIEVDQHILVARVNLWQLEKPYNLESTV